MTVTICSDEVLHLGFLVPWSPGLLIETALASATQDEEDPNGEEDHSKHQSPNPQGLVVCQRNRVRDGRRGWARENACPFPGQAVPPPPHPGLLTLLTIMKRVFFFLLFRCCKKK